MADLKEMLKDKFETIDYRRSCKKVARGQEQPTYHFYLHYTSEGVITDVFVSDKVTPEKVTGRLCYVCSDSDKGVGFYLAYRVWERIEENNVDIRALARMA